MASVIRFFVDMEPLRWWGKSEQRCEKRDQPVESFVVGTKIGFLGQNVDSRLIFFLKKKLHERPISITFVETYLKEVP